MRATLARKIIPAITKTVAVTSIQAQTISISAFSGLNHQTAGSGITDLTPSEETSQHKMPKTNAPIIPRKFRLLGILIGYHCLSVLTLCNFQMLPNSPEHSWQNTEKSGAPSPPAPQKRSCENVIKRKRGGGRGMKSRTEDTFGEQYKALRMALTSHDSCSEIWNCLWSW